MLLMAASQNKLLIAQDRLIFLRQNCVDTTTTIEFEICRGTSRFSSYEIEPSRREDGEDKHQCKEILEKPFVLVMVLSKLIA